MSATTPRRGSARKRGAPTKPASDKASEQTRLLWTPAQMAALRKRWPVQPGKHLKQWIEDHWDGEEPMGPPGPPSLDPNDPTH